MDELTRMKLPAYHINLQEAHTQVFRLCMCYLATSIAYAFDLIESRLSEQEMVTLISFRPLLDYVFSCGFDHLIHLEPTNEDILNSMATLQSEIQKHPSQWRCMCALASSYDPYKSWLTPVHDFIICVLISKFPESFLQGFLSYCPPRAKYDSNPLVHSVCLNKIGHARVLLSHGVDANSVGWDLDKVQSSFNSPLEAALRRKNSEMVDLLLQEGSAAIPQKIYSTMFDGDHFEYPLHLILSLLQADEFVEWASQVQNAETLLLPLDRDRYRPRRAKEKDLLAVTRRLVRIGCDLSSSQQILLLVALAVSERYLSLLEYLFRNDVPMPSRVWEIAPALPHNLALQDDDIKVVAAKGDTLLHQTLARCTHLGLRCWMLYCSRCSALRATLLTILGTKVKSFVDLGSLIAKLIFIIG